MQTRRVYPSWVKIVLEYLNGAIVSTIMDLKRDVGISDQHYRRMIKDKIITTSLNYDHNWVTLTDTIKKSRNHWGLFRYRIEKYSRTVPIFSTKRATKRTLSYLASKRPWGLSESEALDLLGRDCKRPLRELEENHSIQSRIVNGNNVYLNRINKKAEIQAKERRLNPRFRDDEEDREEDAVEYIRYEEFCKTFYDTLNEMDEKAPISNDRITALLLMFTTNRSLRTMESWVNFNPRIQNAIGLDWSIDHTTLCRDMDQIKEQFLKRLFHRLVLKLHDKKIIKNRFLVVDATHIYAFCNTRKNTREHGVHGASWGEHHGKFYGYKIHMLIDAESEMPIGMILSTGKDHDCTHFIPLLDDYEMNYDTKSIYALLADAGYDVTGFNKEVLKKTGAIFLPACNPRRSKILKVMKARVKRLFDTHGDKIHSVEDAFRYLGQTFLSNFGIDVGNPRDNKLVELISERLHRPMRAAVERVFSRLKALTSFERPKARKLSTVMKTIWFCFIGQLIHALTAVDMGIKSSMRKRTALV